MPPSLLLPANVRLLAFPQSSSPGDSNLNFTLPENPKLELKRIAEGDEGVAQSLFAYLRNLKREPNSKTKLSEISSQLDLQPMLLKAAQDGGTALNFIRDVASLGEQTDPAFARLDFTLLESLAARGSPRQILNVVDVLLYCSPRNPEAEQVLRRLNLSGWMDLKGNEIENQKLQDAARRLANIKHPWGHELERRFSQHAFNRQLYLKMNFSAGASNQSGSLRALVGVQGGVGTRYAGVTGSMFYFITPLNQPKIAQLSLAPNVDVLSIPTKLVDAESFVHRLQLGVPIGARCQPGLKCGEFLLGGSLNYSFGAWSHPLLGIETQLTGTPTAKNRNLSPAFFLNLSPAPLILGIMMLVERLPYYF